MTPELFDQLHEMVRAQLTKQHCVREPVSSGERLAMTLRYLSSGDPIQDIALSFRVGVETAREAIYLTCQVIWDTLSPLYMKPPTEDEWRKIADDYWQRWQFPACVGAVDGKHIQIECPKKSGSPFFNYKKTFSVVLMAVADSRYKFVFIDVGASGCTNVVWRMHSGYSWHGLRIFRSPLKLDPSNVDNVVKASCMLHNFLCTHIGSETLYCPLDLVDSEDRAGNFCEGRWRQEMQRSSSVSELESSHARNSSSAAVALRNTIAAYLMTEEGSVP
ncbi:uncharacterized protein LOC135378481 [Ornithodoros turicata]|uniref:uncharacterized protein LOC135378481 n=1 Tax=Ornithodoros turicata TaxID=34597 RepID=UPI00313A1715